MKQHPEFAGSAFEEIIRLQPPIQGFFRVPTEEVHYDGGAVPAGARVLLSFGAANRDPRHYPDPDTFDLRRNPVDHVGFGYGPHGCAGQALARLESVALLQSLITRVESLAPAADPCGGSIQSSAATPAFRSLCNRASGPTRHLRRTRASPSPRPAPDPAVKNSAPAAPAGARIGTPATSHGPVSPAVSAAPCGNSTTPTWFRAPSSRSRCGHRGRRPTGLADRAGEDYLRHPGPQPPASRCTPWWARSAPTSAATRKTPPASPLPRMLMPCVRPALSLSDAKA